MQRLMLSNLLLLGLHALGDELILDLCEPIQTGQRHVHHLLTADCVHQTDTRDTEQLGSKKGGIKMLRGSERSAHFIQSGLQLLSRRVALGHASLLLRPCIRDITRKIYDMRVRQIRGI